MVEVNEKLKTRMQAYFDRFGDIVPLEMVPSSETTEGLIDKIDRSLETGEDVLQTEYGWKFDGSQIY